MSSDRIKRSS